MKSKQSTISKPVKKHLGSIALLALLPAVPLQAALLAYESFDYTTIANGTAVSGDGFSGNWNIGQGGLTVTSNLTYPDLPTANSSAQVAGATRALATLAAPVTSGTVWASFLFQGGGNAGGNTNGLMLTGTTGNLLVGFVAPFSADDSILGLASIDGGNTWAGATGPTSASAASNTATNFLVLELNLDTNTTSLWINPSFSNPGAANLAGYTGVALGDLTGIGINAIAANPTFDEVRIGNSFAEVVGIPEPSTVGLAGLGALALLRRRRGSK